MMGKNSYSKPVFSSSTHNPSKAWVFYFLQKQVLKRKGLERERMLKAKKECFGRKQEESEGGL